MTLTDYLHDYNNCIDYCKTLYDNDSDIQTCINPYSVKYILLFIRK